MAIQFSDRITALRRERGLTQEQLGQLVGVSAQAVSKWEKGGAPDVELLPALADRLGVSIDSLFGRDDRQVKNMSEQLFWWLQSIPRQDRLMQMLHLLANSFFPLFATDGMWDYKAGLPDPFTGSCYYDAGGQTQWMRNCASSEYGQFIGIFSEDFPFYLLLPEPEEGYESNLISNEEYRRLFSVLGQEGSLEILRYLYGQKNVRYTAAAIAKRVGLPLELVKSVLKGMAECELISQDLIEIEDGSMETYAVQADDYAFVPFLYLARWLMEKEGPWLYRLCDRERPVLEAPPAAQIVSAGQKKESMQESTQGRAQKKESQHEE